MKYMFWSVVEISNACGLLMASSAPLMLRHLFTSMMPRGCVLCRQSAGEWSQGGVGSGWRRYACSAPASCGSAATTGLRVQLLHKAPASTNTRH